MAFTNKEYIVLRVVNTIPGYEPLQGFDTYSEASRWARGGDGVLLVWTKAEYERWYDETVAPFYVNRNR